MPDRTAVVLQQQEICDESWACRENAVLHAVQAAAIQGKRPLRFASYNVHKCTGMDGRRDLQRVADVIRSLDADIVSLQEVLADSGEVPSAQVRYLAEQTGMFAAVAGPTKRKKDGLYGNAILSRFPISEVRLHDISFGSSEPRNIIDADIVVGELIVRVLNTHFGLSPRERKFQADRLLDILARKTSPVIVMGDMNSWVYGSPVLRRLYSGLGTTATLRSFPAALPVLALDKIWVLPQAGLQKIEIHRSKLSRIASDHLPVVATVSFAGVVPLVPLSATSVSQ